MAKIDKLTHYPIKGLSGQTLDHVDLSVGEGFPIDRMFGFARFDSGFDPVHPEPLRKNKFIVLAQEERISSLKTHYDPITGLLSIENSNNSKMFNVLTDAGRDEAAAYLTEFLSMNSEHAPSLVTAEPHRFTDVSVVSPQLMNAVSLINADSVAEFSKQIDQTVDPARFRGNIIYSGQQPFSELDMVNKTITLGEVELRVLMRTKRCAATEVNLETGERDLKIPQLLYQSYGHFDMGIYAEVIKGGTIATGDILSFDETLDS